MYAKLLRIECIFFAFHSPNNPRRSSSLNPVVVRRKGVGENNIPCCFSNMPPLFPNYWSLLIPFFSVLFPYGYHICPSVSLICSHYSLIMFVLFSVYCPIISPRFTCDFPTSALLCFPSFPHLSLLFQKYVYIVLLPYDFRISSLFPHFFHIVSLPVVPRKAVAEVSNIGKLQER